MDFLVPSSSGVLPRTKKLIPGAIPTIFTRCSQVQVARQKRKLVEDEARSLEEIPEKKPRTVIEKRERARVIIFNIHCRSSMYYFSIY